jgi:hypothetical protein
MNKVSAKLRQLPGCFCTEFSLPVESNSIDPPQQLYAGEFVDNPGRYLSDHRTPEEYSSCRRAAAMTEFLGKGDSN